MTTHKPKWSIAIFTARESVAVASACVQAVIAAAAGRATTVDVLVNGNRNLADALVQVAPLWKHSDGPVACRVWHLEVPDKAHTWNQYIQELWTGGDVAYFVDGYAVVDGNSLARIAASLEEDPEALAASGVPSVGRSAAGLRKQMQRDGGIHGNLYGIRGDVVNRFRALGFRLPVGLYRNDALLGAVFAFNLDPMRSSWNVHRITVVGDATWTFQPLGWHQPRDIAIHLRRKLRQYQGRFENLAYQDHFAFKRRPIAELPQTSAAMVFGWIASNKRKAILEVLRHPLAVHALYRLWRAPELSGLDVQPQLLWERGEEGMRQVVEQQVSLS